MNQLGSYENDYNGNRSENESKRNKTNTGKIYLGKTLENLHKATVRERNRRTAQNRNWLLIITGLLTELVHSENT